MMDKTELERIRTASEAAYKAGLDVGYMKVVELLRKGSPDVSDSRQSLHDEVADWLEAKKPNIIE